jgi:hypothetical protein
MLRFAQHDNWGRGAGGTAEAVPFQSARRGIHLPVLALVYLGSDGWLGVPSALKAMTRY